MSSLPCAVCGCSDFTKQSGFFICNNCDTQSQDIQEQTFEYIVDDPKLNAIEEKEEIVSCKKDEEHKLTSWECYNIILKGLIDQLIDLGANPNLKVVAFQLWASYLKRGQIAFFSKTKDEFPALPACFKSKDVEVLYGIRNLRRILFKDAFSYRRHRPRKKQQKDDDEDSVASDCANTSLRNLRIKQRKVALSRLNDESLLNDSASTETKSTYFISETEENSNIVSNTDTLESIEETRKRKSGGRLKIAFRSSARKALEDVLHYIKQTKSEQNDKPVSAKKKVSIKNRIFSHKRRNLGSIHIPMNIGVVFSTLRLALLLLEDDIQLADLLRWCCEGHFSLNKPEQFVPIEYLNITQCELVIASRAGFQLDMKNVSTFLEVNNIPTPNLYKLVERYCIDLCLPNDFVKFAHGLIAVFPPQMDYAYYMNRVFPDYECRAMAYILCAFKMLFSLDDLTEARQSEFADTINKLTAEKKMEEIPRLFSWTSWVKYIECRKAVLSYFDIPTNELNHKEYPLNENIVLNYWKKIKPRRKDLKEKKNSINSVLRAQMINTLTQLKRDYVNTDPVEVPEFPVSFTPLKSNIDYLLNNYSNMIPETSREILSNNLTECSIKYILNRAWASDIARTFDLDVEPMDGIADVEIINYELPVSDVPVISKSTVIPAHINIGVELVDDKKKFSKVKTKKKQPKLKKFNSSFETYECTVDDVKKPQSNIFPIYSPSSRYWMFHECGRRVTYETFNSLAEENFSYSFLWLLRECACMLRVERRDLYFELMIVETALCCLFDDESYAQKAPIALFANEW